jgi:hypothetical protein
MNKKYQVWVQNIFKNDEDWEEAMCYAEEEVTKQWMTNNSGFFKRTNEKYTTVFNIKTNKKQKNTNGYQHQSQKTKIGS